MVLFRLIYHNHVYTFSLFIPMAYSLVICTISIELMVYIQLTYNKLLLGYPVVIKVVAFTHSFCQSYTLKILQLNKTNEQ
jgi:hypothetical protein